LLRPFKSIVQLLAEYAMGILPSARPQTILMVDSITEHCHIPCGQHSRETHCNWRPPEFIRPSRRDGQHGQIPREPLRPLAAEWCLWARIQSCIILILPGAWQGEAVRRRMYGSCAWEVPARQGKLRWSLYIYSGTVRDRQAKSVDFISGDAYKGGCRPALENS
jgi:hypothetical protein